MSERQPTRVFGDTDPMWARNEKDDVIRRSRVCECGKAFDQRLLSERFMLIVERQGQRALALFAKRVPEYFVPVHCPSCEHKDLGRQYRLDEMTIHPGSHYEPQEAAGD